MKKETSTESASPDNSAYCPSDLDVDEQLEADRMLKYQLLAAALSYPDDNFFARFTDYSQEKQSIVAEYDRLFRAGGVWLYGAEYQAENEFQRANILSDIMGFYLAFGLEPDKERPDSLNCELEFMHYLIFKKNRAKKDLNSENTLDKVETCQDAQKKFFNAHLYPGAKRIAQKIISQTNTGFYKKIAKEMLDFLEEEKKFYK